MLKRPQPGETEEDLLRYQEEFLAAKAGGTAPLAKLIKMAPRKQPQPSGTSEALPASFTQPVQRDVVEMGELPGQFKHTSTAQPQAKPVPAQQQKARKPKVTIEDIEDDPEQAMDIQDDHITKVLTEIVEHDFHSNVPEFPEGLSVPGGFPKVMHRGDVDQVSEQEAGKPKKKQSLFARQFAKKSAKEFGVRQTSFQPSAQRSVNTSTAPVSAVVHERLAHGSSVTPEQFSPGVLVSGSGLNPERADLEREEIHRGNVDFLAKYSQQEILQKRAEMLQTIDPSILSWLETRQKKSIPDKATPQVLSTPSAAPVTAPSPPVEAAKPAKPSKLEDLPVKPKKGWVHMDKIEYDKLEWMKDVPPPKSGDKHSGKPVRFDFDGKIVTGDEDVPMHLGLHHHGDEPERAGYTLEELFTLARSSNLQQRTIALLTLSRLIGNARSGVFSSSTSVPVIPALLEGGLLFIVRWALDDSTENPLSAAVSCLHSLLVAHQDEAALDEVLSWENGHQVAALACKEQEQDQEGSDAPEETKKTDADLLKEDVIKGVLRMSLLPRLRYLLTKWRPAASVVTEILEILIRIARHSMHAAYQICQCSGLLSCVVEEFVPATWEAVCGSSMARSYGYPVPAAIKLLRVLASAGRHMAAALLAEFDVMGKLMRYIVDAPSGLPEGVGEDLYVESMRTWRVFLSYGLATQHYREVYDVLMRQVFELPARLASSSSSPPSSSSSPSSSPRSETASATAALISVLSGVTSAAAVVTRAGSRPAPPGSFSPALPDLDWSQVSGLLQPIGICVEKCLAHFHQNYFEQQYSLSGAASCVELLATYLSHAASSPGYDPPATQRHLEELSHAALMPLLSGRAWSLALTRLREHSLLLYAGPVDAPEQPPNLPRHASTLGPEAAPCPILAGSSQFVSALCHLLVHIGRLHKGLVHKMFPLVLQHEDMLQYLRRLCQMKKAPAAHNPFAKFENQLLFHVLNMATMAASCVDSRLYHQVALSLMVHLQQGEEYIAHTLLSSVLFNADFLRDVRSSEEEAGRELGEQLRLDDPPAPLSSPAPAALLGTAGTGTTAYAARRDEAMRHLPAARGTYLSALAALTHNLERSRARILNPLETESLLTGDVNELLVPMDWIFLPILELYSKTLQPDSIGQGSEASVPAPLVAKVTNTLRWVYLLEEYRPASVLAAVPLALKLSRILCTFLAGSDLFLDPGVHMYLAGLLRQFCKGSQLDRLDLTAPIPGMSSFYDLYMLVLEQYAAVSYGDALFGSYVLLPLQQCHSPLLRRAVWGERADVLRALRIPLNELQIPIERFLAPEEQNMELLRLYVQNLLTGGASPKWCPLLYLVAVHHTNRFLYTRDRRHTQLKAAIARQILGPNTNQLLRQHVSLYKKANVEADYGMELYDELPAHRQQWMDSLTNTQS